jgi:divalent metal cation (Fe/Co/Zn/Cd) transporter
MSLIGFGGWKTAASKPTVSTRAMWTARRRTSEGEAVQPGGAEWLRLARLARLLSWATLTWLGIEGAVGVVAGLVAGSVALVGFGLDSAIEGLASVIVIWRFTGSRLGSDLSERRAQLLVAVSFFLLAPYISAEAIRSLAAAERAETSVVGLVLTGGTVLICPWLGAAKQRIGSRLGSGATRGEGIQNLLCAYLAAAVFLGLLANTLLGWWWLDPAIALAIALVAVHEGRRAWKGEQCVCASPLTSAVGAARHC